MYVSLKCTPFIEPFRQDRAYSGTSNGPFTDTFKFQTLLSGLYETIPEFFSVLDGLTRSENVRVGPFGVVSRDTMEIVR